MRTLARNLILILPLTLLGCGASQDAESVAVPAPNAESTNSAVVAGNDFPLADPSAAPPPVTGQIAPVALPAQTEVTAEEDAKVEFKDLDGKTITQIQWLEDTVSGYERLRASDPETPRPALTSLEQLVAWRVVTRLPTPPAGKKFHLDLETGKVTVVAK